MKAILIMACISLLASCATSSEVYKKNASLQYDKRPADSIIIQQASALIRPNLKDPGSLKNLHVANAYRCYASKMNFSDNVSPKYQYGYWCFNLSYQATNTYGGYVTGDAFYIFSKGQIQSINELGETVRASDDIWSFHSPSN